MLATDLSPVATSMFDDKGHMRTTQKSHLKTELTVHKSHLGVKTDAYFLDGWASIWVVEWPDVSNAVVQDYLNSFCAHVSRYQETDYVFLLFYRYIDGSPKEVTRLARDKGETKVFKMKPTLKLPPAKLLFP